MRIGEVSRRTGLPRDTIRYYERAGLIVSQASSERSNNYRDYSDDTVERLTMISEARSAGFSVGDLKALFRGLEGMATETFDASGFFDSKIEEVERLVATSRRLLKMLRAARAALAPSGTGRKGQVKRGANLA